MFRVSLTLKFLGAVADRLALVLTISWGRVNDVRPVAKVEG